MGKLAESIETSLRGFASGRNFYLCLGIILIIGLFFRVLYLPADAPIGITKSQDFSTDPPQYTYFAHNLNQHGSWNPYDDPRFAQWEYTTQNIVATALYAVIGSGRAQGNLIAVLFNLISVLLLALAIKNFGSRLGALFFAIFAAFDFTMIWFARTPFLEASQNFWICAAVYLFSLHEKKSWALIAAGAATALAAFFGKMIALFMLGPFTGLWIVQFLSEDQDRKLLTKRVIQYYAGFVAITLIWLVLIYLPSRSEVGGYLAEQALGLYGSPQAFKSVQDFFISLNTLLWERDFFVKMPILTIAGFLGGSIILYWLALRSRAGHWFRSINPGWLLITFWCAVGFLSLFPWNYRPLRYQTTIIFPTMALAGFLLSFAWREIIAPAAAGSKKTSSGPRLWQVAVTQGLWLMPLIGAVLFFLVRKPDEFYFRPFLASPVAYSIGFFVVGALLALIWYAIKRNGFSLRHGAIIGSVIIVLLFVGWNTRAFYNWTELRQYSLLTADRDFEAITNDGAVASGPYGPAITLDNDRGSLIHMFGVVRVDQNLFDEYPITHLAMDQGNEDRAREDYPELMEKAWMITRYVIRGVAVKVFNIAEGSGNAAARAYKPSDYELAQKFISARQEDSAQVYMSRFLESDVANYSADLYVGDALASVGEFERALSHYHKVQEFAPGDPSSALNLGNTMMSIGSSTSNAAWFDSALVYYRIAHRAYPDNSQINNLISQLERRKQ